MNHSSECFILKLKFEELYRDMEEKEKKRKEEERKIKK